MDRDLRNHIIGGTIAIVLGAAILAIVPDFRQAIASYFGNIWAYLTLLLGYLLSSVSIPVYLFWLLLTLPTATLCLFLWPIIHKRYPQRHTEPNLEDYKEDTIQGVLWRWDGRERMIKGHCLKCMTPLIQNKNDAETRTRFYCETCHEVRLELPSGDWSPATDIIKRQIEQRKNNGDWKNSFQRVREVHERAKVA